MNTYRQKKVFSILALALAATAHAEYITNATLTATSAGNLYIGNNSTWGYSDTEDTVDYANCDIVMAPDSWMTLRMPDSAGDFTVRSFKHSQGEGYLEAYAAGANLNVVQDMTLLGKFETNNTRFYTGFNIGGSLNIDLSSVSDQSMSLVAFGECSGKYGGLSGLSVGGSVNVTNTRNLHTVVASTSASDPSFKIAGSMNLTNSVWNIGNKGYDQRTYISLGGLNGDSSSGVFFWGVGGNPFYTLNLTHSASDGVKEFVGQVVTDAGNYESVTFNMQGDGTQIIRSTQAAALYATVNASAGKFLLGANMANQHFIVNISDGFFGAVSDETVQGGAADIGVTNVDKLNWTSGAGGLIVSVDGASNSVVNILDSASLSGDSFNFYLEGDISGSVSYTHLRAHET